MRSTQASPDLRPEFIEKLRILFDILDTGRTGKVGYETLCRRFSELPKPNLPPTFMNCVGKVTPADGQITFGRFLTAVKLSLRDSEINNNNNNNNNMGGLYRTHSEGRLAQGYIPSHKRSPPTMGVNGFDRRPAIYSSNPSVNSSPTNGYSQVVLRPKKTTVRSQKEESRMRHPLAPPGQPPKVTVPLRRPVSTNSYNSVASSGLESVVWRNSALSSNSESLRRNTLCEEEATPRIAKLSGLHGEEDELVRRGLETANRLVLWYNERKESLEKRQRLLGKGCVSLDTAVHEQKLNFLRAHVTELNRRMVALMETSEKGFPTHVNLQKIKIQCTAPIISTKTSRNGSAWSNRGSQQAEGNLPQPHDDQLVWLHRQNQQLSQELADKSRQLDEQKRHHLSYETVHSQSPHHMQPIRPTAVSARPSARVRPATHSPQVVPVTASPVKIYDTLM